MNLGMKLLQIRKGWGLGVKFTRKLMGQETPLQTLVTRVSFSLQKSHSMHRPRGILLCRHVSEVVDPHDSAAENPKAQTVPIVI